MHFAWLIFLPSFLCRDACSEEFAGDSNYLSFFIFLCIRRLAKALLLSIGHFFTYIEAFIDFGSFWLWCFRSVFPFHMVLRYSFDLGLFNLKLNFVHLYFCLQALAIIAFNGGRLNLDTFKMLLSIGPTYAVMNFIESKLFIFSM